MPCRSARRRRSGTPWRSRCAARTRRTPTRARPAAPRPRTRSRARPPPARRTRPGSCGDLFIPDARTRGLEPGERAERVVVEAPREDGEALACAAAREPAGDQALDRVVQLGGRDPPEERPPDRGVGAEAAADEDVVRLPPLAAVVARSRPLEAEVADPVLRAGVRAAVELEPKLRDLRPEALLEHLDQRAEPRLRLRDREVAVRLARARDRVAAQAFLLDRETDPLELEQRLLELGLRDSRQDEVLLARDADIAAEPLREIGDRDHLVTGTEAEMHGD